jgi:hypothetical protein
MQYELRDTNWVDAPRVNPNNPTQVQVQVLVTSGIVGDTYGFTKSDVMTAEFPIAMSGTGMQENTVIQATQFVATKYPNT